MCTHIERRLELKDVIVQTMFEVEKIEEDNQKVGKIGQVINQMFALGLEHDKI